MKWKEVEHSARAYEATLKARVAEAEAADEARRKQFADEQEAKRQAELASVRRILQKFQVEDILAALRDEVWQEGQVEEFEGSYGRGRLRGLRLVSNPYPVVTLNGWGKKLTARLEKDRTCLEVYVATDYPGRNSQLYVRDDNVFNVRDRSSMQVVESVREQGLERGLKDAAVMSMWRTELPTSPIKPDSSNDEFNHLIFDHVNHRRQHDSLPGGIRTWGEAIVSQMPSSLRTIGNLNPQELRDWEDDIRGYSIHQRLARRIFN